MLNQSLVIARKEIVDAGRDVRAVVSSALYALMGSLVVGLVSLSDHSRPEVIGGMMSVFTLVAAFVGGMNVAMDAVAGERERRSLLPLLLNPVTRLDIIVGKWLAVSLFAIAGLALNLVGFTLVLPVNVTSPRLIFVLAVGIFPLTLAAASTQLLISTMCRGVKEAQTYLSLVVFLPMMAGMFLVFFPVGRQYWFSFLPLVGQQLQLQLVMAGKSISLLQPVVLGCLTVYVALLILVVTAGRLKRDEIVYGD
jgi:sodium transport system permease protein